MKYLSLLLLIVAGACSTTKQESKEELTANDTISTRTGLQYYYIKKGEGRKIVEGSLVAAYNRLYLNDVDTVFWASEDNEDSTFTFIQGRTSLIKGALELYPLLREGDEVVAIMPDSIAYGKEDNRGIPGGSTLTFNPIIIRRVSEPKESLADTLWAILETGSVEEMMDVYRSISSSDLSNNYHMGLDQLGSLFTLTSKAERYEDAEKLAIAFEKVATNREERQGAWYSQLRAILQQGDTLRAISRTKEIIAMDPDEDYWKSMLEDLQKPSK